MVSRGIRPSWTAWRESENTPVMSACEAMTVAAVDRMTMKSANEGFGAIEKKGSDAASGSLMTTAAWPR